MATAPAAFSFPVPTSTANLGPGFGVVGLALDLPLHVTVEPRTDGNVEVVREDLPERRILDARHDPVLRGFRAGVEALEVDVRKGVTVTVRGDIPRGIGLGSHAAAVAAGIGAAARLARGVVVPQLCYRTLVDLGGDPVHGAASLLGGLVALAPLPQPRSVPGDRPPRTRIIRYGFWESWRLLVVLPNAQLATSETRRVLPPTVPHAVAHRTAGRVQGLLHALREGDRELLAGCLVDELHVPFRARLVPGTADALEAGRAAGAAGVTLSGHGPALLAILSPEDDRDAVAAAMKEAFRRAGRSATVLDCRAKSEGALHEE